MDWQLLGGISAFVTFLSFLLLVISKAISVCYRKEQFINEFTFDYFPVSHSKESISEVKNPDIFDEVIIDENPDNGPMFLISSAPLRYIDFFRINDKSGNPLEHREKIQSYTNLPSNRLLKIQISIPEGYAIYEIKACRHDYAIIIKDASYNGSSYSKNNAPVGHFTFKSFLYYFLS